MRLETFAFVVLGSLLAVGACNQSDFGDDDTEPLPPDEPPGPGDPAWGSDDVSCTAAEQCASNEACIDNVCQMARCKDGPYDSIAPIGQRHFFFRDREILTADETMFEGQYWVDSYLPTGSSFTYPTGGGSYQMGVNRITDVAGGNILGTRPERFVIASAGRQSVVVQNGNSPVTLTLSFVPVAVAAGDVDHDSIDEVIALSATGRFAVCEAMDLECDEYNISGSVVGIDAAAADIDGDGYDEPVFLIKTDNQTEIIAINVNSEESEEEQIVGAGFDTDYMRMDAGDVDGDGVAEVFALEDGGFLGFAKDHVHVWALGADTQMRSNLEVDADSKDVHADDVDMDQKSELMVLYNTKTVALYEGPATALTESYSGDLASSSSPTAIATADTDGDSPSATMISETPELIASVPVPIMVLHFPPYSETYSENRGKIWVGRTDSVSESFTDTVGLRAGVEIGVGAEIPGIVSAELKGSVNTYVFQNRTLTTTKTFGGRFSIDPDPEKHGPSYAVVMLSSSCFHSYKYQIDDPSGSMGGDDGEFVVLVPVGGQTTVWSSNRYNAMATAVGTMPLVAEQTFELGNPDSYPNVPLKPDGSIIDPASMVFSSPPRILVSDVGDTGWWLSIDEQETNDASIFTELGVSSTIKVNGFSFSGNAAAGTGNAYGISIGNNSLFGGYVPPIVDDPNTPEDEYEAHSFAFTPHVYRETYVDAAGNPGGYYSMTFAVGQ